MRLRSSVISAALALCACGGGKQGDSASESRAGKAKLQELEDAYGPLIEAEEQCKGAITKVIDGNPDALGERSEAPAAVAPTSRAALADARPIAYFPRRKGDSEPPFAPLEDVSLPAGTYTAGAVCLAEVEPWSEVKTRLMTDPVYAWGKPEDVAKALEAVKRFETLEPPARVVVRWRRCKTEGTTEYGYTAPDGQDYAAPTAVSSWTCQVGYTWIDVTSGKVLAAATGEGKGDPESRPSQGSVREIQAVDAKAYGKAIAGAEAQIAATIASWPE